MSDTLELPIAQHRALLTDKRDRYLMLALDAEVEAVAIAVQKHGVTDRERNRAILQHRDKAANCRASAAEIDRLLRELPTEPEPDA